MTNREKKRMILALETTIGEGSVSLLNNVNEIDNVRGLNGVSKSTTILENIDRLLKKNGVKKHTLTTIAVSKGPGSLTGRRVGLSIAKGISDALNLEICEVSILDALAGLANFQDKVITAVGTGKSELRFQESRIIGNIIKRKSFDCKFNDFLSYVKNTSINKDFTVILTKDLAGHLIQTDFQNNFGSFVNIIEAESNLAKYIGRVILTQGFDGDFNC